MSLPASAVVPSKEIWDRDFETALKDYRRGSGILASKILHRIVAEGSENPLHLSYCGVVAAVVDRSRDQGLRLCRRALTMGFMEPQVYLNLAQVEEAVGRQDEAMRTLRKGLRAVPDHPELTREIVRLNPRQTPPISFLSRSNWLNQAFGRLLALLPG